MWWTYYHLKQFPLTVQNLPLKIKILKAFNVAENAHSVLIKVTAECMNDLMKIFHHHHVQEGLGLIPVPCILKMKLVPPSLPRSSYVFLSFGLYCSACLGILFVSILCTCCSHFSWYCFISFTIFPAPVFSLIHWFFFLYLVLLFQESVLKISSVLLLNVVPLFSSVPRFHFRISMLL